MIMIERRACLYGEYFSLTGCQSMSWLYVATEPWFTGCERILRESKELTGWHGQVHKGTEYTEGVQQLVVIVPSQSLWRTARNSRFMLEPVQLMNIHFLCYLLSATVFCCHCQWVRFSDLTFLTTLYGLQGGYVPQFICWCRWYINRLFAYWTSLFIYFIIYFITHLLPYLSTPSRIDPFRFQAGGRRMRPKLALVF